MEIKLKQLFVGLLLLIAGVFCLQRADAAFPSSGKYPTGSAPSGYVGPVDSTVTTTTGLVDCWSLRACNSVLARSGVTTVPVVDVAGGSPFQQCTIFLLGNGMGGIDTTTSGPSGFGNQCSGGAAAACAGGSGCLVTKWYGQINGVNISQAGGAIIFSCIGSLPCINPSTNSESFTATVASFTPGSFSTVAIRTSVSGDVGAVVAPSSSTIDGLIFKSTSGQIALQLSSSDQLILSGVTENAWHAIAGVMNTFNSKLYADNIGIGGCSTGSCSSNPSGTSIAVGGSFTNLNLLAGEMFEEILWTNTTQLSITQIGVLCHNQFTYVGTSVSC